MTIERDIVLVNHILDAIEAINKFIGQTNIVDFSQNDLLQSAVVKKFEIIGEASNKLSEQFKLKHSKVPWISIVGMRNVLIHDYTGVDYEGVWNTIDIYLPDLKQELDIYRFK
jgi:uncharacterized protein with HEPN domain